MSLLAEVTAVVLGQGGVPYPFYSDPLVIVLDSYLCVISIAVVIARREFVKLHPWFGVGWSICSFGFAGAVLVAFDRYFYKALPADPLRSLWALREVGLTVLLTGWLRLRVKGET